MASITKLFIKKEKGQLMQSVQSCSLERGYGIESDINASSISPRQVLITRKEDLDFYKISYGGLRENIIIEGLSADIFLAGSLLIIGDVQIRLTFNCEPCMRIADVVPSLVEILGKRGILGVILTNGQIRVGENVVCEKGVFEPLSEIPYERFLTFVKQIPHGKVITYKTITVGMGVAESYIRAIPKYIEKASLEATKLPLHRIVDSAGNLIENYIKNQAKKLESENIEVNYENSLFEDNVRIYVQLNKFLWLGDSLYME